MDTIARTYRLSAETIDRIDQAAADNEAYVSPLVELLLSFALDALDAGKLTFTRRPVAWVVERGDGQG